LTENWAPWRLELEVPVRERKERIEYWTVSPRETWTVEEYWFPLAGAGPSWVRSQPSISTLTKGVALEGRERAKEQAAARRAVELRVRR